MVLTTTWLDPSAFFCSESKAESRFHAEGFQRIEQTLNDACSELVSIHSQHSAQIHYLRITPGDTKINVASWATVERMSSQ